MSAWIQTITPDSSIVPYHMISTPVSLRVYHTFIYQILSLLRWLQQGC